MPSEVRISQQRQKFGGKKNHWKRGLLNFLFLTSAGAGEGGYKHLLHAYGLLLKTPLGPIPPSACDWCRTGRREGARPRWGTDSGSDFPWKPRKSPLSHMGRRDMVLLHFCVSWAGLSGTEQERARVGPGIISNQETTATKHGDTTLTAMKPRYPVSGAK